MLIATTGITSGVGRRFAEVAIARGHRVRGLVRDDSRADAQAQQIRLALHPWPLRVVGQQAALSGWQHHFADQPALAGQRTFQFTQVRLYLTVGREVFHQHLQHTAAGQADPRARVAAIAITQQIQWFGKGAGNQLLKQFILDAAAG